MFGENLTSDQLATQIILHELGHVKGLKDDVDDKSTFTRSILINCLVIAIS